MLRIMGHILSIAVFSLAMMIGPSDLMAGPENSKTNYVLDR